MTCKVDFKFTENFLYIYITEDTGKCFSRRMLKREVILSIHCTEKDLLIDLPTGDSLMFSIENIRSEEFLNSDAIFFKFSTWLYFEGRKS